MDAITILTSAGVAGVVTLVIEYLAKPTLEARKDRILAHDRARREAAAELLSALNKWGMMREYLLELQKPDLKRDVAVVLHRHVDRLEQELHAQHPDLMRQATLLADPKDPVMMEMMSSAAGHLEGAAERRFTSEEVDERLRVSVLRARNVILTRRRSSGGRKSRQAARALLNERGQKG
jgi:hypothetical protein